MTVARVQRAAPLSVFSASSIPVSALIVTKRSPVVDEKTILRLECPVPQPSSCGRFTSGLRGNYFISSCFLYDAANDFLACSKLIATIHRCKVYTGWVGVCTNTILPGRPRVACGPRACAARVPQAVARRPGRVRTGDCRRLDACQRGAWMQDASGSLPLNRAAGRGSGPDQQMR